MKRHSFKPAYFITGLIFAVIAIGAMFGPYDDDSLFEWLLPATFIAIGAVFVGSAIAKRS